MEMQQPKAGNQTQNEEDVLNFDLDDISLDDIDQQGPAKNEEIIELTDLVARGMPIEDTRGEADAEPLKEGQPSEEETFKLLADDLAGLESAAEKKGAAEPGVEDFALELDLPDGEKPADSKAEAAEEIVSGADLEAILKDEEPLELIPEKEVISDEKTLEEIVSLSDLEDGAEQSRPDLPDVIRDDLLEEEEQTLESAGGRKESAEVPRFEEPEGPARPALKPLQENEEPFADAAPAAAAGPAMAGISEERLEAIVTKVVQDVLERVARETMASVAERVIGEAIESLRKSLSENP